MRKIEQELLTAIRASKSWKKANTAYNAETGGVYLHGNLIATIDNGQPVPIPATFAAWPTRTTASRLNALGLTATIRNFTPHLDGVALY